jgi:hypothetical protein
MSDEEFDTKRKQFNDLWDGVTPKGINRTKSLKFRQYIREHVRQKFHKPKPGANQKSATGHANLTSKSQILSKENCEKYWMGELQKELLDAETF